jgi:hypothetical protein
VKLSTVAIAFLTTFVGLAVREYYHAAATKFYVDYWSSPTEPMGPPKCKFDCTMSVPQETWMIGTLGLALVLAGPAILIIDWAMKRE